MDQTQLLDWHGESDAEDPSDGTGDSEESPKPVGRLHLLSSKYGPEKDFWIYPGKNVIGRLESCQICLPVSSVSKAHAVIEVPSPGGPHLLYDQESLNRTRRQRVVLIPHVRYSLQDGDTLVFGDVGCQYFMLDPEGAPESPDDSLEVPPTQPRMDANALVIEETPAPGRKMGFGGFLVQDSDREEEGEEVVNGAGKALPLPVDDGADSSIKHGARGHCSLASSVFFSPSATVVPESDEESGEPSEGGPPCPSLRLRYESNEAEPRSLANGAVTPLNQEMHPIQPGSTEAKVSPDTGGQPVAKDQDASADPSFTDFHLDSDTDMEDEEGVGTTSERLAAKDGLALELGSDTDTEEPSVANPGVGSAGNGQLANDVDSDTDIGEAEKNPSVLDLKADQATENRDSDTDAEGSMDNPGVASPESQESSLQCENSRKGEERADSSPEGDCPHEEVDSDTDVEAVENPAMGSTSEPPMKSQDDDTDAEELSLGAENQKDALKDHEASRDSDTDVEVADMEPERLGGTHPHSPQPMRNKDSAADVEEIKGIGLQGNRDVTDDATGGKSTGVEPPECYRAAGEQSTGLDAREPITDTKTVEQLTSMPQNQHLLAISVDSDTDVEEAAEIPNESPKENYKDTGDGPREGNSGICSGNLEVGPGEDEDSDTDVEATSPSPKTRAAHDSDTDVEVVTSASPGKPLEEQETQLVLVRPSVGGEETTGSEKELKVCCDPCKEDEDTDAEGNESPPDDESGTDDEDDSDLALQATQCYLPAETSSPTAERERRTATADSRCALEEAATQAFVFRSPLSCSKFQSGKTCSSPLKEEDPDVYMLEATQPFCKEPAMLSEEPTQAFVAEEEEDTELFVQQPLEGDRRSEQATQAAVPVSAVGGQQDPRVPKDPTQPCSAKVFWAEPDPPPAGGAAAEEPHKEGEIQTVPLVQVPPSVSSRPLAPPEVEKASGSEEEACAASLEGGVAAELSRSQGGAGRVEGGPEERCSEPAKEARDAEQGPARSPPTSGRRSRRQSTESKPAGTTRSRSHSWAASAAPLPKVLFTGVIDEEGERVVTELGGSLAESVTDCTHLVTDRVRRTVKFLCALARGIPIVTLDWLDKSKRNSFFLAPNGFLVHDPEQEKNFQFSLAKSLQKARQKGGLLQGYELHVTPNVKPEPEHMRDIIKCSGGTFLPRMPRAYKDKRVVISCPEDLQRCKPAQDAGVPIANAEFILTGILQQKADLDAHRLGGVGAPSLASPAASTTRAGKRRAAMPTAPAPPSTAKRRR